MRDQFIARGAPADRCHVIAPAVDDARLAAADPEVRQRLGIAPDDLVLLAPGESSRDSLHRSALWATAILNFLDPRYRLLIWGHGAMVDSLRRFAAATEGDRLLISARAVLGSQVDFEQIIPAADAAIYCAQPGSPILPAAICLAAGLPMVATASAEAVEFLHDRDNALLEPSLNPRCLAERVRDLQADAGILQSLTRRARQSAEKDFSIAQNIAQWRQLYSTLSGFDALDFTHSPDISTPVQGSSNVLTGNSESVWATSGK
jgi:glycosyltransferase involved in cell wall biosynthesis